MGSRKISDPARLEDNPGFAFFPNDRIALTLPYGDAPVPSGKILSFLNGRGRRD